MAPRLERNEKNEWQQRLERFMHFRTSRDTEQRKAWNDWFKKLEEEEPLTAREFMKNVHGAEYKSHGEQWLGKVKDTKPIRGKPK